MSAIINFFDAFFKARIVNHISFWVVTVLLLAYHGSLFGGNFRNNLINMMAIVPVQMMAAYFLIYVQIPYWLFKGHWVKFISSFIIVAYVLSILARLSVIYIAQPIMHIDGMEESLWEISTDPIFLIKVYMTSVYIPAFLLFLIKMTKERFLQENRLVTLEKEKRFAELNFLKAQMNPHFLFNTLNNIYALSRSKSEQTPEMIMKLSEILDYTIYECSAAKVPVIKEWQLIENFADLQALRHDNQLMIVIDQDIDNDETVIAPLILISLVENAFKHTSMHTQANIKVFLKVKHDVLIFEVFNSLSSSNTKKHSDKKGIGVPNVKRQLALQYPDRHTMHIDHQADFYKITLSIQL